MLKIVKPEQQCSGGRTTTQLPTAFCEPQPTAHEEHPFFYLIMWHVLGERKRLMSVSVSTDDYEGGVIIFIVLGMKTGSTGNCRQPVWSTNTHKYRQKQRLKHPVIKQLIFPEGQSKHTPTVMLKLCAPVIFNLMYLLSHRIIKISSHPTKKEKITSHIHIIWGHQYLPIVINILMSCQVNHLCLNAGCRIALF